MPILPRNLLWNLFLAVVPALLAYLVAWGLGKGGKRPLPLWVCLPLVLVWFVFLPNTCYLLTEWRHLLFDRRWAGLLDAGRTDRIAMLKTAKWALFFLAYSGTGVLLFALAVRPMEQWLRANGRNPLPFAPVFFFLMSLGVYLGLIERLNSWDIINRPRHVLDEAVEGVTNRMLLISIGVFAALLWALYEAVDIWVDGVAERIKRLRGGGAPPARGSKSKKK